MSPAPGAFNFWVKEVAIGRNGGRCERCNQRAAGEFHHRRPRRMGGAGRSEAHVTGGAANCLCLCPPCHDDAERRNRSQAIDEGVILKSGQMPEEVPVTAFMGGRHGRWLLDGMGRYHRTDFKQEGPNQ